MDLITMIGVKDNTRLMLKKRSENIERAGRVYDFPKAVTEGLSGVSWYPWSENA